MYSAMPLVMHKDKQHPCQVSNAYMYMLYVYTIWIVSHANIYILQQHHTISAQRDLREN